MVLGGCADLRRHSLFKAPLWSNLAFGTLLKAGDLERDCDPKGAVWYLCRDGAQQDLNLGVPRGLNNRAILKSLDWKFHLEPGKFFSWQKLHENWCVLRTGQFQEISISWWICAPWKNSWGLFVCKDALKKHHWSSQVWHPLCSEKWKPCQHVQIPQRDWEWLEVAGDLLMEMEKSPLHRICKWDRTKPWKRAGTEQSSLTNPSAPAVFCSLMVHCEPGWEVVPSLLELPRSAVGAAGRVEVLRLGTTAWSQSPRGLNWY